MKVTRVLTLPEVLAALEQLGDEDLYAVIARAQGLLLGRQERDKDHKGCKERKHRGHRGAAAFVSLVFALFAAFVSLALFHVEDITAKRRLGVPCRP